MNDRMDASVAHSTASAGRQRRNDFYSDPEHLGQEWRRLLAEFVGTFALAFVAAGGAVFAAATPPGTGLAARVVAPALLAMAMIYTLGDVSGAHFNPAVTLAFAVRKNFPWTRIPGYRAVQVTAAIAAAALLRAMSGPVGHLGATLPHHGQATSMVLEAFLTFSWSPSSSARRPGTN